MSEDLERLETLAGRLSIGRHAPRESGEDSAAIMRVVLEFRRLVESLRAVNRIVTKDDATTAFFSPDHLCDGKCPDEDDMKIRDPDCLPCVAMDFPASVTASAVSTGRNT